MPVPVGRVSRRASARERHIPHETNALFVTLRSGSDTSLRIVIFGYRHIVNSVARLSQP
jgi:hypothetical protein